jgi:PAS domain S-box-containing protein
MRDEDRSKKKGLSKIAEASKGEEEYKKIIQASMDGFWINDIRGRILDVNTAYCDLIGYSREELLNMHIADLEVVEKPAETAAHIQKIMEIGSDRFVTRHRCKDGKVVDIEISVNYLKDPSERFVVFIRDITDRLRIENELLLKEGSYRTIIENSPS